MNTQLRNTVLSVSFSGKDGLHVDAKHKNHLAELIRGYPLGNVLGTLDRKITSIAFDSRKVTPGGLFVAIHGFKRDGSRFIEDAIQRGAVAFITEERIENLSPLGLGVKDVTAITVRDARDALAWLSASFYRHPCERLQVVGITGTNGKTTLTYILETLFRERGLSSGVIGTVNYRYGGHDYPAPVTTPESLEINRMLDEMTEQHIPHCFLEVSSHSLALKRVHGMKFEVGIFTNLSRDHLDFHGSMARYKEAKKGLFRDNQVNQQVINTDDPVGREIVKEFPGTRWTTGIDHPADLMAENCILTEKGSRFTLLTPSGTREIETHLLGKHNIYNLLSGAAAALLLGLSLDDVSRGLRSVDRIPGRFEKIDLGQDFGLVVDYAHTDAALHNVLEAARSFTKNRILVVFGCGGDRDRGKRKAMGRVALEQSDFAVITSDNPRSEDPQQIIDDILEGVPAGAKNDRDYTVLVQRQEAIEYAIDRARSGDLVVIAGKGHEDYQILKTGTIHFDDREVAREALRKRGTLD